MVVGILWERAFVLYRPILLLFQALRLLVFSFPLVPTLVVCHFTLIVLLAGYCPL